MTTIITKKKAWCNLINQCENADFYHTFDYHLLSKSLNETPILIQYKEDNKVIGLPLLLRKIGNTNYFDATSVYGYSGPLTINIDSDFDNINFKNELNKVLLEQNIITVFSRLNPFVSNQETVLKNIGFIYNSGKIVNIDLTKKLENQKKDYSKRYKTYINKSRKLCYIKKVNSKDDITEFVKIYHANMKRVNATSNYFFPKEYFFSFFDSNAFQTELLVAIDKLSNEIIAGAMFIKKNKIIQYHLSGSKENYLEYNAIKLLIDEMRLQASSENFIFFNLGGGVGNKEDSLLKFKSGFSKDYKTFKLWKYTIDQNLYKNLVFQMQTKSCKLNFNNCTDFFPCYRCNLMLHKENEN